MLFMATGKPAHLGCKFFQAYLWPYTALCTPDDG